MTYLSHTIPDNCNPVFSSEDGATVDIDVLFDFGRVRYTASEADPGYEHSEELYSRATAGELGPVGPYAPPLVATTPDYIAFWDALTTSSVYASIREQSFTSLPMNMLTTELIALLGDAKAGRPNEAAIQQSMTAILTAGTFTEAQLAELQTALEAGHLADIYALS